MNLGEPVS